MKLSHFLILLSLCCLMAPSAPAKTNSTPIPAKEFGYLDFEIESHEPGIQCIPNLTSKVPTISGSVEFFDEILLFDLNENSGKLYKNLNKTIVLNPGKTLILLLKKRNKIEKVEKVELKIHSSHSLTAASQDQQEIADYFQEEEHRFRPIPKSTFKDFDIMPEFVELFNDKIGPSPILIRPRLLGLKALSLPYTSKEGQSILRALA